ncbi:SMP-30/gluconolactonase/LRE family protein [Jannaschia sp. LMIT008]|uniref:SMP-30/gluconolactonase/LRE family protein n=1 Tax=Jannaschia maritima TaxID=3032585 RepID=UPI002810B4C9|nr:SMP-30/gluconolactonase/LRE family protein [Jannaschia sp. LMIT008]
MNTSITDQVRPAVSSPDILGESPIWDERAARLYWVDVRAPALRSLDPHTGAVQSRAMPEVIASVMLRAAGGLVVGLKSGLYAFDPESETLDLLRAIGEPHEGNRVNDCKVDRKGAIWWSTMWDFGSRTTGSLYRLRPDGANETLRADITIPNGLCFGPEGDRAYFADTPTGRMESAKIAADGAIGRWRDFGAPAGLPGNPDGSACDSEGCVWNARYGGGAVVCLSPEGEILRRIDLPVSQPSCCAFGGPDRRSLFITTSRQGLSEEALQREPLAGCLLQIDVDVAGQREVGYGG